MAITDSIADMLTVVRNANSARKPVCEVRASRVAEEILKIFKQEGFISNYKAIKDTRQGLLRVYFKYAKDGARAITGIRRISKPGLRIYKKADDLPRVLGGLGIAVVSTSKGIVTDNEAREKRLGGEVMCYIW